MEEIITLCGDNCTECPRYNAHSDEELKAVAELWYKIGWRECVVSNEDIACSGCSSHKQCSHSRFIAPRPVFVSTTFSKVSLL